VSDNPNDAGGRPARELAQRAADFLLERDAMSRALGMKLVQIGPGSARVSMVVRADMVNGHGSCHGGVLFSLADSAFAFACNTYNATTVAAGATIDFLAPARQGDELTAIANEVWRSRRSGVYDVSVINQREERIALFRGRSHQLDSKLIHD
jgi:phenylacetic acid degradation protein PaaD